MKKHRMFTALCGFAVTASILAACGNAANDPAPAPQNANGGEATEAPLEGLSTRIVPEGETLVLRFYNADGAMNPASGQSDIMAEITRRTGIELEIITPIGGHDQYTDVPLMISSGDIPDLIFANTATGMLIEHNAIIDLEPLIMSDYGANFRALYGNMLNRLRHSNEDPRIFHAGTTFVDYERITTSGTAQIQMAVMRELGFPEINTLQDLEEAIATYMELNPTINGQPTIGLSLIGSNWRWGITVGNPSKFTSGITDDGGWVIDFETGEATLNWLRPETKEYFRWLNGMNHRGLLDPEWATQTEDTYFEKIATGRTLAVMDQNWSIGSSQAALRDAGLHDGGESHWRMMMPVPAMLEEGMTPQVTRPTGYRGMVGIAISASSSHQTEAFRFIDFIASEEGQLLLNWGIEGVHYFYEDGVRTFYPEMAEIRDTDSDTWQRVFGIGNYVHPFPQLGNMTIDSTGNPITPNTREDHMRNLTDAQRETLEAYGVELFIDLFPTFNESYTIPHGEAWTINTGSGTELDIIMGRISGFANEQITQSVLVNPADFDAHWDAFIAEIIDMGAHRAGELYTVYVQSRHALWAE